MKVWEELILNEVRYQLTDQQEKYESNGISMNKKRHNFIGLIRLKKLWLQLCRGKCMGACVFAGFGPCRMEGQPIIDIFEEY